MAETLQTSRELGTFLRARRERLDPDDLGLRNHRPRRTPGLRREEVAELAGVSIDYVIRLEQGRGLRPSAEILDALAGALRLTADERTYLFDLAGQRLTNQTKAASAAEAAGPLTQLVQDLSPLPAMVINHRNDILAWNAEMIALLDIDLAALPDRERNGLWLCLLHPAMDGYYLDRELIIRQSIADLRAAWAAHPDDLELTDLIEELLARSPEFARLWLLRDVNVRGRGIKRLEHRRAGRLTIQFEVLAAVEEPDHRLVIYRAADPDSQATLDRIVEAAAREHPGM
jgi:transcriptional regulator with XRE-family HTH domain